MIVKTHTHLSQSNKTTSTMWRG